MADFVLLVRVVVVMFAISNSFSDLVLAAPSDELYSESPCEVRSLSALKDSQGNLWGVGEGNLWWFNATNLCWSLLPLPTGILTSDPWRVTCGDPQRYVSLQGPSGTLVLHLPWQHWQQVDTDDLRAGTIDASATWCESGTLYATDTSRSTLYSLDQEEARWIVQSDILGEDDLNDTSTGGVIRTWLMPDGQFILIEEQETCSHLLVTNSSGIGWSLMAKRKGKETWPTLDAKVVTWVQGTDKLWLWKSIKDGDELWVFSNSELQWMKVPNTKTEMPNLNDVLTTWMNGSELCFLTRSGTCTTQYSPSSTQCLESIKGIPTSASPVSNSSTSTAGTTVVFKTVLANETLMTHVIIPPPTTGMTTSPTSRPHLNPVQSAVNKHSLLAAMQSDKGAKESIGDTAITAVIPARNNPWHQHTSVFGSVIFFGTSLTIFGVVGSFWCVRRCVHFPKEALLLRDPPSVRYTAIPDSVSYDTRGQPTTTYAVIPDSIA